MRLFFFLKQLVMVMIARLVRVRVLWFCLSLHSVVFHGTIFVERFGTLLGVDFDSFRMGMPQW